MKAKLAFLAAISIAGAAHAMELSSADIKAGAPIAQEQLYTKCGGANRSPELSWSGAPAGTKSYALSVIDTSVKPSGWSHWIILNIPAKITHLAKGAALPAGAKAVVSNFGDKKYDGPCPPAGSGVHQYVFTVYALSGKPPSIQPDTNAAAAAFVLSSIATAKASITATAQAH